MDSLYTAVSLSLITQKRFCIITDEFSVAYGMLLSLLTKSCNIQELEITTVDIQECVKLDGRKGILNAMVKPGSDGVLQCYQVVIWRRLGLVDKETQNREVFHFLNEVDAYDTYKGRRNTGNKVMIEGKEVEIPELFLIVPIVEALPAHPNIHQYVKEKFWFAQSIQSLDVSGPTEQVELVENYEEFILKLRNEVMPQVYSSPDILRYIYSLVVHARNHRLCSLSPVHGRLSTRALQNIRLLTISMVAWRHHADNKLYATPDLCKIAMRKVGYWLVDWEFESIFANDDNAASTLLRKKLEIWMLTGDWYGSEWKYVQEYLADSRAEKSPYYSNRIIDDALAAVQPPV